MSSDIPLALDRRKVTVQLAERLGSLEQFLAGIDGLLKFNHLDDCELQRHGRKVGSFLLVHVL